LVAVSKKLIIAPSVDLEEIASDTEGYSGADLQAIMYNAHLEVVHASIAEEAEVGGRKESGEGKGKGKGKGKEGVVHVAEKARAWTQIAPVEDVGVSQLERKAFNARVSHYIQFHGTRLCHQIDSIVDNTTSSVANEEKGTMKPIKVSRPSGKDTQDEADNVCSL
jgi:peroxin-1